MGDDPAPGWADTRDRLKDGSPGSYQALMKGTIVRCLQDFVEQEHGPQAWRRITERARLPQILTPNAELADEKIEVLVEAAREELPAGDVLGDAGVFWARRYAPRVYPEYYEEYESLRAFLEAVNEIHREVTHFVPSSTPAYLELEWLDPSCLRIRYRTHRPLFPFALGVVRGLATHFGETVEIEDVTGQRAMVRWVEDRPEPRPSVRVTLGPNA